MLYLYIIICILFCRSLSYTQKAEEKRLRLVALESERTFENPPKVSEDEVINLERAYKWHTVFQWSKKEAVEKAGTTIYKLNQALNAGGVNKRPEIGRPSQLTEEVIQAVLGRITTGAYTIDSIELTRGAPNSLHQVISEEIKKKQNNTLANPPPVDWKTQKEWARTIMIRGDCIQRLAEIKAKGRKDAYMNIRNPFAFASVMNCLYNFRGVHPELLLSTDDISILIHPSMSDKKPIVIAPKVALEWLQQNNIGVSVSAHELYKQRMITIKLTISRTRDVMKALIVYDRSFADCVEKPKIYSMGNRIYVALAHPSINQQVLEYYFQVRCIEPEAEILK